MISCGDCRHYIRGDIYPRCAKTQSKETYSSKFNGEKQVEYYVLPDTIDVVRGDESRCGKEAKWFEPKTPLRDFAGSALVAAIVASVFLVIALAAFGFYKIISWAIEYGGWQI